MDKGWKNTLIRALRTFGQAAIGYLAADFYFVRWNEVIN